MIGRFLAHGAIRCINFDHTGNALTISDIPQFISDAPDVLEVRGEVRTRGVEERGGERHRVVGFPGGAAIAIACVELRFNAQLRSKIQKKWNREHQRSRVGNFDLGREICLLIVHHEINLRVDG